MRACAECGTGEARARGLCSNCYARDFRKRHLFIGPKLPKKAPSKTYFGSVCTGCRVALPEKRSIARWCSDCQRNRCMHEMRQKRGTTLTSCVDCGACTKSFRAQRCETCKKRQSWQYTLAWIRRNPVKARLRGARRRARLLASASPGVTAGEWEAICAAFDHRCAYCPDYGDTIDHVVALTRGGLDEPRNVVPACRSCNASKKAKPVDVWAGPGWQAAIDEFLTWVLPPKAEAA